MKSSITIITSAIVILIVAVYAGRKLKLSPRYDRTPKSLNSWDALNKGIDPSDEKST